MARQYPFQAVASEILDQLGLDYEFDKKGKHPFVRIEFPSGPRKISFSGSPSDGMRALKNQRSFLRRVCREEGFTNV